MIIQLKTLADAKLAMQHLGAEKLPAKASYSIARNLRKINPDIEEYDKKVNELIIKYGTDEGDGNFRIKPQTPAFDAFKEELEQLQNLEVEVDIHLLKLDDLPSITPNDLALLDFMIEAPDVP